jgi:hypothetical protein
MVWVIRRLPSLRSRSPVGVAQLWNVRHQDSFEMILSWLAWRRFEQLALMSKLPVIRKRLARAGLCGEQVRQLAGGRAFGFA